MDFSDEERGQEESAAMAELLEYARKAQAMDLRKRYGKPMPGDSDFESAEGLMREDLGADQREEAVIPGVEPDEATGNVTAEGEGSDDDARHAMLRDLLSKMQAGEVEG